MKEEMMMALIKELFTYNNLHEEYSFNDDSFILDLKKEDDNNITIKVTLKEKDNKDKKEFEKWVNSLDDDIFNETWESLSEEFGLKELNDAYKTENYQQVIDMFKDRATQVITNKINNLKGLLAF